MASRRDNDEVNAWLRALGLGQYSRLFAANEIDRDTLEDLNEDDLRELDIPLGHRKKILKAIRQGRNEVSGTHDAQLTNPPRDPGEWRHLTVLVVDLVDSTSLARQVEPEALASLFSAYHSACVRTVRRYGGHVARYRGDGILAYFGWPEAHEDNAERAVFTGLDLLRAVKGVSSQVSSPLRIRVGIATGEVIVGGLLELDNTEIYEAFGETPSLAARLEAIAGAGNVFISEETHTLVRNKFECVSLGNRTLKGFDVPVGIYQVNRARALVFNFEARTAIGLTPLVGRTAEINLLQERWQRAGFGEGQVVLLAGEPGIGKSRLIGEFRTSLGNYPTQPISFQCSPLHADSPLYPITKCFGHLAGFNLEDPPETKLQRLSETVESRMDGVTNTDYYFSSLFGIEPPDDTVVPVMSPDRRRTRALQLLVDYVILNSAPHTSLVLFEDAHWMDPTTSEFLDILIDRAETAGLLLIITFRPGFSPPWQGHSHQTTLTPNRLTRKQSCSMIEAMSGAVELPQRIKDEIVQRSDGNPLYVEELTTAVLGSVRSDLRNNTPEGHSQLVAEIPATLQDTLHARIDRLSLASKEFVQTCSIVGRRFSFEHIRAISGTTEATTENLLSELVDIGLLHAMGQPPEAEYTFKHALIQDAAYSTMLASERENLHRTCAKALEKHFPAYCKNEPGLLAQHWEAAGSALAAIPYYHDAGQLAAERSALTEAEAYLQKGLDLIGALPQSEQQRIDEMKLRGILGRVYIFARGWSDPSVHSQFTRALELHGDCGFDEHGRVPFEWALSTYHLLRGEITSAVSGGNRIVKVAERSRDEDLLTVAHSAATIYGFYAGRFSDAIGHMDRTLISYRPQMSADVQKAYGTDRRLQALRGGALSYWCLGDHERAMRLDDEQRSAVFGTGRTFEYTYALTISCILNALCRDAGKMQTYAEQAIDLGDERGFSFLATNAENFKALGEALEEPGKAAIRACRQAVKNYQASGNNMGISSMLAIIAELHGTTGQPQDGLEVVEEGLAYVARSGEHFAEADLLRVKGDLLILMAEPAAAVKCFAQAIEVARAQKARSWELQASIPLAKQHLADRHTKKAIHLLQPICNWPSEKDTTADTDVVAQALLAEAQLQDRKGQLDA